MNATETEQLFVVKLTKNYAEEDSIASICRLLNRGFEDSNVAIRIKLDTDERNYRLLVTNPGEPRK